METIKVGGKTQAQVDEAAALKEQKRINQEARSYLAYTDWYVVRKQETGEEIPAEILEARQAARDRVVHIDEGAMDPGP